MHIKITLALAIGTSALAALPASASSSDLGRQQLEVQRAMASDVRRIAESQAGQNTAGRQPEPIDAPCPPGADKRASDLCAQWKAADAAADSAWWAWASGMLGALSLLGIIAALLLTIDSNRIARNTARQQLRAYMGVTSCSIQLLDDGTGFILQAELHNAGQTPAYNARIFGETFAAAYPLESEREFLPVQSDYATPIMPGHSLTGAYRITSDDAAATLDHVRAGSIALYIQGICTYTDAFRKTRETKFRYVFGGRIANTAGLILHAAETGNSAT